MAPPSYTRATASSTLKASPRPPRAKETETPKGTPKKLKRPSTLTIKDRQTITYNADLHPIKPLDTKKPCPLATLPSELRTIIYTYILDQNPGITHPKQLRSAKRDQPPRYIWPSLLHICRAIRIEAAYTYYTCTPFTFAVRNLNFSPVIKWVESLPPDHRKLLSRNKCMKVDILPEFLNTFTYPPPNYLLDNFISEHWKACAPFGNLYALSSDVHRKHFIVFCRLATWWRWCDQSVNRNIAWRYDLVEDGAQVECDWIPDQRNFLFVCLMEEISVLVLGCVRKVWTRNTRTAEMRREAERMLDALDGWSFRPAGAPRKLVDVYKESLSLLKRVVGKW